MKDNNKYPGINPYPDNLNFIFRGRDEEIRELYLRIRRNNYTVYYAETGEGKTSLIKAGLFPMIRQREFFPIYITLEEEDFAKDHFPLYEKIEARIREWNDNHKGAEVGCFVEKDEKRSVKDLFDKDEWLGLRSCCIRRWDSTMNGWERDYSKGGEEVHLAPLLIFDQFEEVFTKGKFEWIDSFMQWLGRITSEFVSSDLNKPEGIEDVESLFTKNHFRMLFSMRTEYLGELDYWCTQRYYIFSLQDNRLCLKPLTRKGAMEVISLSEELKKPEIVSAILEGCAKEGEKDNKADDAPCIYALVLSVICYSLLEAKGKEQEVLLKDFQGDSDKTVDKILYNFYLSGLRKVGITTEAEIEQFSNAFVNESGKRKRHNMGDAEMKPYQGVIREIKDKKDPKDPKDKENNLVALGLIKTQGKTQDGNLIVELPHDRICKAVNTYRQEKRKEIERKNIRLKEWMQFGIISVILGITALSIWWLVSPEDSIMKDFIRAINTTKSLPKDEGYYEGYYTSIGLLLYALVFPPLVSFVFGNEKLWKYFSIAIFSLLGTVGFATVIFCSYKITSNITIFAMWAGGVICLPTTLFALYKLKQLFKLRKEISKNKISQEKAYITLWPLCGGYCAFFIALAFIFTVNETFGVPTPNDSYWAIIVLPLLSCATTWGLFKFKKADQLSKPWSRFSVILIAGLIVVSSLLLFIDVCGGFKPFLFGQNPVPFGRWMWAIFIMLIAIAVWMAMANSWKNRLIGIAVNGVLLLAISIANLGYNPFKVKPSSVLLVASWKTVIVKDNTNPKEMKLGVVYWDGDTILPCRIEVDEKVLTGIAEGSPFKYNKHHAFIKSSKVYDKKQEKDSSYYFKIDSYNYVYGGFPCTPPLDGYIRTIQNKGLRDEMSRQDTINYYAAKLFVELREANIHYLDAAKAYNLSVLPSYDKLCEIQAKAWKEVRDTLTKDSCKLTDSELFNFHRELGRSFFLLQLKDRVVHGDYRNIFFLTGLQIPLFFYDIKGMETTLTVNTKLKTSSNSVTSGTLKINQDDIFARKPYTWYYVFNTLCYSDLNYNKESYVELLAENTNVIFENAEGILKSFQDSLNSIKIDPSKLKYGFDLQSAISEMVGEYVRKRKDIAEQNINLIKSLLFRCYSKQTDSAFVAFKNEVFDCLIPIMGNQPDCIYYNDFETICKNLLQVAAFRGQSTADSIRIDSCNKVKDTNIVKEIESETWKIFSELSDSLKLDR